MSKDSRIGFALNSDVRKRIERIADAEGVSISTVVRWAIEKYLTKEKNGRQAHKPQGVK